MKNLLLPSVLLLPIGMLAQGNFQINPPAQQAQNVNYYIQVDDNNNYLGNTSININDDENPIQTNIGNQQKANPPSEQQGISLGNFFGSTGNDNAQQNKPCTDCDEVKAAIKASHASSGGTSHRKTGGLKKWGKKFSYNTQLKMKKLFAKKYKAKTTFASCFSWG